jgi:hypothetical protein
MSWPSERPGPGKGGRPDHSRQTVRTDWLTGLLFLIVPAVALALLLPTVTEALNAFQQVTDVLPTR